MKPYQNSNPTDLANDAITLRKRILTSLFDSGGGHYGGALSVIDILMVLYKKVVNSNPLSASDRIILSKGHSAIALYVILAHLGLIDEKQLGNYGKFNMGLEGHPDMHETPGVHFSSGSLGQGLSVGLGMALGLRECQAHVWVVLGDGECQEGQIWEAAILAARYRVGNLHVIIDSNGAQEFGYKHDPSLAQEPIPNLAEKWKSFGWSVQQVSGHNHAQLEQVFDIKDAIDTPRVIIAETQKGHNIPTFMGNPEKYHCVTLTDNEHKLALNELELACQND